MHGKNRKSETPFENGQKLSKSTVYRSMALGLFNGQTRNTSRLQHLLNAAKEIDLFKNLQGTYIDEP